MQLTSIDAELRAAEATFSPPSTDKPLRICLLGYRSHPYCGGQGVYIKYLSRALVEAGHQVDVISGEPYPELDSRVNLIKMPGLNLYAHFPNHVRALRLKHLKSWTDTFEWFSMATGGFPEPYTFGRRVFKYLRQHKDDYDLIHDNQSLCYGLLELQKLGIPIVATVHHPITQDLRIALDSEANWKSRLLIKRWHSFLNMQTKVVRKLRHVITVSECSRRDIAKDFNVPENRIGLVYNGIDTNEFCPIPEIPRLSRRLMATASADVPLKGLDNLLKALAALIPRYPDLDLMVIGKPKPGGATESLIQELSLTERVQFVSGIPSRGIVERYARATVAVVPSIYEGFGLPAGEAMACGVPVVSTDGGALPEVVGDAGLVVPAGNVDALTTAISRFLDSPEMRLEYGMKGRDRILEKFSWTVAAQQMTDYYQTILAHADC